MDDKEKIQIITHNLMVGLVNRKISKEDRDNWTQYKDAIISEIDQGVLFEKEGEYGRN